MSGRTGFILKVYRVLLRFYPAAFRSEFGEEMQAVFARALAEGQSPGGKQLWREIRDWPGSVLQEHLRERRWEMFSNGLGEKKPLPRSELLAAMIIFVLPLLSFFATNIISLPQWTDTILVVLFWGAVLFAFGLAVIRGVPGWSLPYLGFILLLGLIMLRYDRIWGWIYPVFLRLFGARSDWPLVVRTIYVGVFSFIMLFSLLLGALIAVNLLRLLPYTRSIWQRLRADWTQLSFMLYGGLVFGIMLAFDEYHYEEFWKLASWVCLALGAWRYLRAKNQKQRFLSLVYGASGSMWVIALAKWVLIPFQKWPMGYPVSPSPTTRWVETGGTLIGWICILAALTAPALLNLFPGAPGAILSKEENITTA